MFRAFGQLLLAAREWRHTMAGIVARGQRHLRRRTVQNMTETTTGSIIHGTTYEKMDGTRDVIIHGDWQQTSFARYLITGRN